MNNAIRKWIATQYVLPQEGQKVYYFCPQVGIFRGEFHTIPSSFSNPNKFSSNHGVLDADDVSYWMPYDHSLRDMIPLPPDYNKIDAHNLQSMINSGLDLNFDEVEIPKEHRKTKFTYEIMREI